MRPIIGLMTVTIATCDPDLSRPVIEDPHHLLNARALQDLGTSYDDWMRWTGAPDLGITTIRITRHARDRIHEPSIWRRSTLEVSAQPQQERALYHQLCHEFDRDRGFSSEHADLLTPERIPQAWLKYDKHEVAAEAFASTCEMPPRTGDSWYVSDGESACGQVPGVNAVDQMMIDEVYRFQRPRNDGDLSLDIEAPISIELPKGGGYRGPYSMVGIGGGLALLRLNGSHEVALDWVDPVSRTARRLRSGSEEHSVWHVFGGPERGALLIDTGPHEGTLIPIGRDGTLGRAFPLEQNDSTGSYGVVGDDTLFLTEEGGTGQHLWAFDLNRGESVPASLPSPSSGAPAVLIMHLAAGPKSLVGGLFEGKMDCENDYCGIGVSRTFVSTYTRDRNTWSLKTEGMLHMYATENLLEGRIWGRTFGAPLLATYDIRADKLLVDKRHCLRDGELIVFENRAWLVEGGDGRVTLTRLDIHI